MPRDELRNVRHAIRPVNRPKTTWRDRFMLVWLLLRTYFAGGQRATQVYAKTNASEYLRTRVSDLCWRTVSCIFGPWVGVDRVRASMHHVGRFFSKCQWPGSPAPHWHVENDFEFPGEEEEKDSEAVPRKPRPWAHGVPGCRRWLVLRGPSNLVWFDPWVAHLSSCGVRFQFNTRLVTIEDKTDGMRLVFGSGDEHIPDYVILATDPYSTRDILRLSRFRGVNASVREKFEALAAEPEHVQVSFEIAFRSKIRLPRGECAMILPDTPFNLTICAQDVVWRHDISLGTGYKSLWTGTACVSEAIGRLYNKRMREHTRQEFIDEVRAEILGCAELCTIVREENGGTMALATELAAATVTVWHEWIFPGDDGNDRKSITAGPAHKKWLNSSSGNQSHMPRTKIPGVANLFLAGAHVRVSDDTADDADLYSMEQAATSGVAAARAVVETWNKVGPGERRPLPEVIKQYVPRWVKAVRAIDDRLYACRLPNVLDVFAFGVGLLLSLPLLVRWQLWS